MAIVLNTIKEVLEFIEDIDGWGIISTDEELQVERLLELDLIADYTPEKGKSYLEYLRSHVAINDILILIQAQYNVKSLEDINYFELKKLAEEYGY